MEEATQESESQFGSFFDLRPGDQLIMYTKPLFGLDISYKRDTFEPEPFSTSMLNNYAYDLRLARSITLVLDQQYIMKSSVGRNMSECIMFYIQVNCFDRT